MIFHIVFVNENLALSYNLLIELRKHKSSKIILYEISRFIAYFFTIMQYLNAA